MVTADDAYAEDLKIHHYQSTEREPFAGAPACNFSKISDRNDPATRELSVGEPVPDFTLTDQTGRPVSLSQFAGKVVAASFVYTSCPLPNYCFRLSNNLGRLQKRFADRYGARFGAAEHHHRSRARHAGGAGEKYAATWKADPNSWHFLTGPEADVKTVCRSFGVNSGRTEEP